MQHLLFVILIRKKYGFANFGFDFDTVETNFIKNAIMKVRLYDKEYRIPAS